MSIASSRTTVGKQFSEGARLLWEVMRERGLSQGALARLIGAKAGIVPRWLYGDTRPRWDWATKLRDVLGIPLEAWSAEPTQPFTPPAAANAQSLALADSGANLAIPNAPASGPTLDELDQASGE